MKKLIALSMGVILTLVSCQSEKKEKEDTKIVIGKKKEKASAFDTGKAIFNGKGKCYTCHKIEQKSIGPGVIEIMKVYNEKDGDLIAFMKQEAEPIVDPSTYAVMKTNFAVIKTFTEDELNAVAEYMIKVAKDY